MTRSLFRLRFVALAVIVMTALLINAAPANAQDTATGIVVSSSLSSLTVRTESGQHQLYIFGRNVRKPDTLPAGSQVRVVSSPGNEPGVRVATQITVTQAAAPNRDTSNDPIVPAEVRRLERDLERVARRFQVGVRGGVALDPELVLIGVDAQIGPFFRSDVYFRPSIDFGIGEVTAMFGINPEFIYRLPFSAREDRWSTYVGGGLGINLIHQSFEGEEDGRRIDFGDFKSDTALNIIGGVRRRSGMFMELKTSVYSEPSPSLRLMVGYTF